MIRRNRHELRAYDRLPRMRGDDPDAPAIVLTTGSFAPHARG